MTNRSVLFVVPDYHTSFIYRDELRAQGWKAGVYVPADYPDQMLFSENGILRAWRIRRDFVGVESVNALINFIYFTFLTFRYRYQIHYGSLATAPTIERLLAQHNLAKPSFLLSLSFAKALRRKIVYIPSGCRDEELRTEFEKLDNGSVCGNCGYSDRCNDQNIVPNLDRVNRYADLVLGSGFFKASKLSSVHFKYKVINLKRWTPSEQVGNDLGKKLRLLHSHSLGTRSSNSLNIKGSVEIVEAIKRLADEFLNVELMEVSGVRSEEMVLLQQQADIIVDQLRYGYWGSTGIEAMALGKVLVCYVRPSWKEFFLKQFPEHKDLPVVHATPDNIYEVLRQLVLDKSKRDELSRASREFAEKQYDSVENTKALIKILESL
jgi:glycosyltransferase involved in cell wall biosynthesis